MSFISGVSSSSSSSSLKAKLFQTKFGNVVKDLHFPGHDKFKITKVWTVNSPNGVVTDFFGGQHEALLFELINEEKTIIYAGMEFCNDSTVKLIVCSTRDEALINIEKRAKIIKEEKFINGRGLSYLISLAKNWDHGWSLWNNCQEFRGWVIKWLNEK